MAFKRIIFLFIFPLLVGNMYAQNSDKDKGQFTGNLLANYQKYLRDDDIGATTKAYRQNTASTDAWLFMQYRIKDYSFILRYDGFNNSPLLDPLDIYTNHGIGFWQISKKLNNLEITAGSFYDQFGSGVLFRAYEQRQIGIDYAIQGLRLAYNFKDKWNNDWRIKGFSGNQKGTNKNRFDYAPQVISGINLEGSIALKTDSKDLGNLQVGTSAINRTLDGASMDWLVSNINTYDRDNQFFPKYNVYGFNGYFTYNIGNLSWNVEGNYKTKEAVVGMDNRLSNKDGKVFYSSLSWGKSKMKVGDSSQVSIGLNVQGRHVDHFTFKTSPRAILLDGLVSYLPSLTKQNTYRLMARYNAPGQDLGENGIQGEIECKIGSKKKIKRFFGETRISFNASYVQSLASNGKYDSSSSKMKPIQLFREYNLEVVQNLGKDKLKLGVQSIFYNQARYEQEPEYEAVNTITPFFEWLHKTHSGKSFRLEGQFLYTKQDQGSFANIVLEYYFSKNFSVSAGDMLNVIPHRYPNMAISNKIIHYPSFFMAYVHDNSVYTLAFIKQQSGVNCSGGICRLEPAFSGVRFTISSNF